MINPFKDTDWNPGLAKRRDFARSLIIGFPLLGAALSLFGIWRGGGWHTGFLWLGAVGCALGVALWLLPQVAKPFYLVWYFAACCIGVVLSNVLLAAFYYLVITPIGLTMRLFGRDPMRRRFDPHRASYWRDAENVVDPERYFRQF